jgi:hypothetical protein
MIAGKNCKVSARAPFLDFSKSPATLEERNSSTTRRFAMAIIWESEMNKSLARGQAEKKPILLDFFNPG